MTFPAHKGICYSSLFRLKKLANVCPNVLQILLPVIEICQFDGLNFILIVLKKVGCDVSNIQLHEAIDITIRPFVQSLLNFGE